MHKVYCCVWQQASRMVQDLDTGVQDFLGIDYFLHFQAHPCDHALHIRHEAFLCDNLGVFQQQMWREKGDKNLQIPLNWEWIDENKTLKYWIRTVVGWEFSASLLILPWTNDFSKYSFIPITIMWLVTSLLSLCPVCLINKLFWLTIFRVLMSSSRQKTCPVLAVMSTIKEGKNNLKECSLKWFIWNYYWVLYSIMLEQLWLPE